MHKGAALSVAAVVLGPVELFTQFCLVVLRDIYPLLQLVAPVGESALNSKNTNIVITEVEIIDDSKEF